jgi:serine/threonine protein kinase
MRQASLVGKLGYSPPEQLRLGQCYPCSDLYALGVTALVLLTGKYPTALMNQETLEWRWRNYVTPSRPLAQMLDRLLMPKPRDRYQSAQEVLQVLETLPALSHVASDPLLVPNASIDPALLRDASPVADSTSVSSGSKLIVTSDPAFIDQCRQELARCVGPMAHMIVDDTLTQYPEITPEGFVETLASQISSSGQATEFKSRIALSVSTVRSQVQAASVLQSAPQTTGNPQVRPGSSMLTEPPIPAHLNAAFLDRCRQELARAIGPMAGFLVEEALADYPNISLRGLVEVLMAEIPDARQATEFQQRLGY